MQRQTADNPAGLRAARQAFPFVEILVRWAWRCHTPEPVKDKPSTKNTSKASRTSNKRRNAVEKRDRIRTAVPVGAPSPAALGRRHRNERQEPFEMDGGGVVQEGSVGGRENTGVASLLATLAAADPSGETIRCLQRWACNAVLLDEVSESWPHELDRGVQRSEVARAVISTHDIFVAGRKNNRQRWMRACREVGEILRLLVLAIDEREPDTNVKGMVNHALFVTTFLRAMPQGVAARKGYEQVIAAGRVPGDTKGMAASAVLPRVKTWREAVAVLDSGIANILEVDEAKVKSDEFRQALCAVLVTWQSPYTLADYYVMHRKHREVARQYLRFLRAVLGVSGETVRDIRIKDLSNQEHMRHFPESVRQLWEAEPSTLAGTVDPKVMFRMGEDTRSCMGIRRSCASQNRALLGYLLQGNVRLIGLHSSCGRMEARAILRLLLRSDNMTPALLMESIYYSSNPDPVLEQQVLAEVRSVSEALGVPVYRAGDKVPLPLPVDESMAKFSTKEDDQQRRLSTFVAKPSMCALVEMDGLSAWIYSDGAVGVVRNPGLLHRDTYPGASRRIVLAELEYQERLIGLRHLVAIS